MGDDDLFIAWVGQSEGKEARRSDQQNPEDMEHNVHARDKRGF